MPNALNTSNALNTPNALKKFAIALATTFSTLSTATAAPLTDNEIHDFINQIRHQQPIKREYEYIQPRNYARAEENEYEDLDLYSIPGYDEANDADIESLETTEEKCFAAIDLSKPYAAVFPRANVGFIEGDSYACAVNLRNNTLTRSYNLNTHSGRIALEEAVTRASRTDQPRPHHGHGHGHHRYRNFHR